MPPYVSNCTPKIKRGWLHESSDNYLDLLRNPVPTLWLSNSIRGLDRAFIRRFDMVFELPVPDRKSVV